MIRYPDKRWSQATTWVKRCEDHPECGVTESPYVPTRLIDVSSKEGLGKLRLIVTVDHKIPDISATQSRYVALSYCWGESMTSGGVTTTANRISHLKEIIFDSLPQTIRDAVIITRGLGVRYLWVDALCIIQDDIQDWQRESGAMIKIYSEAYFTIAAAISAHCDGGILNKQDKRQLLTVPLKNFSLKASTPTLRDQKESSPLSRRAWALQERELSPRILWFFKHMLGFECREIWATEAEPRGQAHLFDAFGVRDRSLGLGMRKWPSKSQIESVGIPSSMPASESNTLGEIYLSWRTTVEEYSSRELTRASDKLPALSGLAHMVQASVGSQYAAGLWVNDFLRGLLWRRLRTTGAPLSRVVSRDRSLAGSADSSPSLSLSLRRFSNYFFDFVAASPAPDAYLTQSPIGPKKARPSPYVAPSWSWASVKGPVDYRVAKPSQRTDPAGPDKSLNAIVLSISVKPLGSDPMGEVLSGHVRLMGWVRSLRDWLAKPRDSWSEDLIRWDNDNEETDGVMILGLMRHDPFLEDVPAYNGLLIKETAMEREYMRVGLIKTVHASWLGEVHKKEIVLV